MVPEANGRPSLQPPESFGWLVWATLVNDVIPPGDVRAATLRRHCSVRECDHSPAVAIRRSPSGSRRGFWQAYCDEHGEARGVRVSPVGLVWTEDGADALRSRRG